MASSTSPSSTSGLVWKLIAAGWELDDHTFTHPDLTTLGAAALEREVGASRRFLRKQYRQPIPFFCYPSGRYDDTVLAAVRRAGYLGATTTNPGIARPGQGLFTLDRIRVDGSDGVAGFAKRFRSLRLVGPL